MVLSVTKSSSVVSPHQQDLCGGGGRVNVKGGMVEDQKTNTNATATAESLRHCMNQRLLMMREARQSRRRLSREGDAAGKSLTTNETPSVPYLSTLFKDSTILKSLVVVTNDDDGDDEMKLKKKTTTTTRREPRRRASLDDRHYSSSKHENNKKEKELHRSSRRRTSLPELEQTASAMSDTPTSVKVNATKHEEEELNINEKSGPRGLYHNDDCDEKQDETNKSLRLEKILKESEEACSVGGGDGSSTVVSDTSLPFIPRNEVLSKRRGSINEFNNTSTTIYEQSSDDDESSKHSHRSNKHVTSDSSNEHEEALQKEVEQLRETLRLTSIELSVRDTQHQQELCAQEMKVKELEREKASLEEELQHYMKENDELVHDVMDSQMMIDELKTKNTAQEEALKMLAKRNDELEQQRDELREEVLQISGKTYHRDNHDIELIQHKFDEYKRFTKKEKASMLSDQTELQTRLDQVTKERDELEKRLASFMMMSSQEQQRKSSGTSPTGLYEKSYRRGSSFDLFSTTNDEPRRPSSDMKAKNNNMSYSSAEHHSSAAALADPATGQPIVVGKQPGSSTMRRRGSWMELGNKAIEALKGTNTCVEPQQAMGDSSNATWAAATATGNYGGKRRTSTTAPSPAFQLSLAAPLSPSSSSPVVSHRRRSFIDLETLKKSSDRELAVDQMNENSLTKPPSDPFAGSIAAAAAAVAAEYFCSDDEDDEDDTFHCSSSPRSNSTSNKLCTTDTCTSSKVTSRRRASTTGMAYPSLQNLGK